MTDRTKVRIGRLTSVGRVGIEIARLYRHARRGEIETIEAYRLASVLSVLKSCLEASEIEQRLEELETALREREQYRPRLVS
jgi:hypothetical protein